MSANRTNGFFNTLNVVNDKGRIRLDDDGNIRLVGTNFFLNISDKLQINTSGKLNLTSTDSDIIIDSQTGSVKIEAGADGVSAILLNNQNPNGGITIQSGLSGTNMTSTGDINITSQGNDVYIGYADNDFGLTGVEETHNVYIEANDTISNNAKYIQLVASDVISILAPEINFGTAPSAPFLRIVDDCLLIDSIEPHGIRKVLIDTDNDSLSKPGYDGLLIRSRNNDISTDITVQTSDLNTYQLPISDLSFGVEALNSKNGQTEQFVAFKKNSAVVSIDYPRDFTSNDIGKYLYWHSDQTTEQITGLTGFISQPSVSTSDPTTSLTIGSSYLTTSGVYTGNTRKYYKIQIDDVSATPNKFKWSNNEGLTFQSEFINITTGVPFLLEDGIYITFSTNTGFDLDTYWTFLAIPTVITNGITANIDTQSVHILQPGMSYITNKYRQDLVLKTSDQERLRITENGNVSVGNSNPTATLEVQNKVGNKILLSTNYIGQQTNPSVACLGNGGWVAVWESFTDMTNKYDIYAQIFYPDGTRNGEQFIVNTTTLNQQSSPYVAALENPSTSQFIVVWNSEEPTNLGKYNIQGRIYDAEYTDGSRAKTIEFTVNTTVLYTQKYPRATGLKKNPFNNGYNYVVVWSSNQTDGVNIDTYFQIINANGSMIGAETKVNTTTSLRQTYPDVSYIDTLDSRIPGGFVVAFISEQSNNFFDVRFQMFTASGVAYGSETLVTSDNQKSYGRVSVEGLYGGDFIISYNESYYGDNRNLTYNPLGASDTILGSTSATQGILSGVNLTEPYTKIEITVASGDNYLIGEEITTSLSNRTEKIKNIRVISSTILEIELSRDTKVIKAAKYNTSPSLIYSIPSVNTTLFQNDPAILLQNPAEWTINYTTDTYNYTLPTIAETYDKNFIITWSNGFNSTIYYQKFEALTGNKLGNEKLLYKNRIGTKEKTPVISKLVNKNQQDAGMVIVYSAETYDTSYQGVFGILINDDNSLMKVSNNNGTMTFTNQGFLGITTTSNATHPDTLLHLSGQNPDITLKSTDPTIGNNYANSKIIFKNDEDVKLAEIVGCYSTSYQSRNPKFEYLLRWFQFDDASGENFVADSSQSNTSGRLNNFDVFNDWTDGKIKRALKFSGQQYINCGINTDFLNIITTDTGLSISTWVKTFQGGTSGITSTILSTGNVSTGHFNLKINNNCEPFAFVNTNSGIKTIRGTVSGGICDGSWHNLVVVYDNDVNQLKMYVDGVATGITGTTLDYTPPSPVNNLIIGSIDGANQFLSGYLDDLRIYNTALTVSDVAKIYDNITQTKGKIVMRTNNGVSMPDDSSVRNFTIDADGYIESYRSRSLPDSTLTGSIKPIDDTLNGLNTRFYSEVNIGDAIIINNVSRIVTGIISDTLLTVNVTYQGVLPESYFEDVIRKPSLFTTLDNNEVIRTLITSEGKMSIGNPDPSAKLVISGTDDSTDYPDLHFNNLTPINLGNQEGGISRIVFNSTDGAGQKLQIGKIETQVNIDVDTQLYDSKLKFNLTNQSSDTQVMVLNNLGFLGLNNQSGFSPQTHLHIIDSDANNVSILMESGSPANQINGAQSTLEFKSKNITDSYAKISGSSDTTLSGSSKGRLDFITHDGSVDRQRLVINSDGKVSFHLPELINDFHISPILYEGIGGQSVTLTGTTVYGIGTPFTSSYIGAIIYFKTSKTSRLITNVIDANTLTVSTSGVLPSQSYAIYSPGFNMTENLEFGLGVVSPTSTVQMKGSFANDVKIITYEDCDEYNMIGGIYYLGVHIPNTPDNHPATSVFVDTTSGVVIIRLPPSASCSGRIYNIKKVAGTNDIIIDGYSTLELIDYIAQWTISDIYKSIIIQSDGVSKWNVLSVSSSSGMSGLADTDELAEGSINLYYTDARVLTVIDNIDTNYLAEGTSNLYFTEARVNALTAPLYDAVNTLSISFDPVGSAANAEANVLNYIGALTTDDLTQGTTNLYCSSSNVLAGISTQTISPGTINITDDIYKTIGITTQLISSTTDVTLNYSNGIITTYNISLSASSALKFTVNNNKVSTGDQVFATITGTSPDPSPNYLFPMVSIYNITNGSFNVVLRNPHSSSTCSGEYDISYQIIKKL